MQYRRIDKTDAPFLTELFQTLEYDLYFAEKQTSAEDWAERIS